MNEDQVVFSYIEGHESCGLQVGDKVRVTHQIEPHGWDPGWGPDMDEYIGKTGEITGDDSEYGFILWFFHEGEECEFYFPFQALEKIRDPKKSKKSQTFLNL